MKMSVYLLIGLQFADTHDFVGEETIVAAFDSREKAARAMYLYDDSEYADMWIKEMEVQ